VTTANSDGFKAVDQVTINNVASQSLASKAVNFRIVAKDDQVTVYCENQYLWTFDLANLKDGTNNYYRTTATNIELFTNAGGGSSVVTVRLHDLADCIEGVPLAFNKAVRQMIDDVTRDRHVVSRSTQVGGVKYSRFWNRELGGGLGVNTDSDKWQYVDSRQIGHIRVVGDSVVADVYDDTISRTEGYKFDIVNNPLIKTVDEAIEEGNLWMRRQKEYLMMFTVMGRGRILWQPEDYVTFGYTGAENASRGGMSVVLETIVLTADSKKVDGTYTVRLFV
jgi:hypothetical protein